MGLVLPLSPPALAAGRDPVPAVSSAPAPARPSGKDTLQQVQEAVDLAVTLQAGGLFDQAARLWESLLPLFEAALGPQHRLTAQARSNLGQLYVRLSRFREAEALLLSAQTALEASLGPEHQDVAIALNNLASLYEDQGRLSEAETLYLRSLSIRRKVSGAASAGTASAIDNLAGLYKRQGRFSEAETLLLQALTIRERALGSSHADVAVSLNNLAVFREAQGRFSEAEALQLRALAIRQARLGAQHPMTLTSLSNLASVQDSLGRHGEAEALARRVLRLREKTLGPEHLSTALSLTNLAAIVSRQGRPLEAERLYRRAQTIVEKLLPAGHESRALALSNRAGVVQEQGRLREAEALYREALALRERALGRDHPDTAIVLNNLATNLAAQGRQPEALALYVRARAISTATLGPGHPNTARATDNLAGVLLVQERFGEVRPLLESLHLQQSLWLRRELPLQPRSLRPAQLATQPDVPGTTFALLDRDPGAAALALEVRLNRQGLLAEIEQRQHLLRGSSAENRIQAERLAGLDQQLAAVSLTPDQRNALRQAQQQQEAELYRRLPALRIDPVATAQVAAALRDTAPRGLLVEFQKYRSFGRTAAGTGAWGPERFMALLLWPDGRIRAIPLGEAATIEATVVAAVGASADANRQEEALQRLAEVSQRLLGPLQSQLVGVRELFIAPDGELNRLPFAALPAVSSAERTLGEAVSLRLLTTGRDLLRLQQQARPGGPPVLIANPDFDASTRGRPPGTATTAWLGLPPWQPLSGTAEEARLLVPLLRPQAVLSGREATSARVLQQRGPRILHIATHGFFLPEVARPAGRDAVGSGATLPPEDPLQRSGLVFAGANHSGADAADDGYLTAAELTGMDLEGTDLVTLSACETGQGAVERGEGVYGLQRALTVAGARSTLLSLWKVDDDATAAFMEQFYRRLRAGESRADALRETQASFRSHKNSAYNDVRVWGAFQLSGDWRPLTPW